MPGMRQIENLALLSREAEWKSRVGSDSEGVRASSVFESSAMPSESG